MPINFSARPDLINYQQSADLPRTCMWPSGLPVCGNQNLSWRRLEAKIEIEATSARVKLLRADGLNVVADLTAWKLKCVVCRHEREHDEHESCRCRFVSSQIVWTV